MKDRADQSGMGQGRDWRRIGAVLPRPGQRWMSVKDAMEWTFATERVHLDFDELGTQPPATDTIYRLMQRGLLGCEIDGGGVTAKHEDAEIIASLVATLPSKSLAADVAIYARTRSAPDAMVGQVPRCCPVETRMTKHGEFARTESLGVGEIVSRGRKVQYAVLVCPITYRPSRDQISAARLHYLEWWGALLTLRHLLAKTPLRTIRITPDLPPMEPWISDDVDAGGASVAGA